MKKSRDTVPNPSHLEEEEEDGEGVEDSTEDKPRQVGNQQVGWKILNIIKVIKKNEGVDPDP